MLGLLIENDNDNSEENQFTSIEFDEGWTASEIEDWAEQNDIDLSECTITFTEGSAHQDWDEVSDWDLSEKEELCEMLNSFSSGWKPNRDKEEALFLYLQNAHFRYAYLGQFENAYIGKYSSEEECAIELNQALVDAVEAAGYSSSFIDEKYLAKERGADYTFAVTGGVYCFRNV